MHRSSRAAALCSQSPTASPTVKHVAPDGVLASPFSGQHVADTLSAQSDRAVLPGDSSVPQPASVVALSQPVASTYSSRAQSELSAKGLQVE